ncbi:MAG: hypothetical protein L3J29_10135 [Cyclobacteriaceae bacterium]|nr:hypothetical protein [Cyclobacteriaceae bacterium]
MGKTSLITLFLILISYVSTVAQNDEFVVSKEMYEINLVKGQRINIAFGLMFGSGRSEFSYDITTPAPGFENSEIVAREFSADYTNLQIPITVSYSYKGISLGVKYSLTSTRATDRQVNYTFEDGRIVGGLDKGEQDWFQNRTYYGPFIEYDFKVARMFYISPSYGYMWYTLGKKDNTFFKPHQFANPVPYNDAFVNRTSNHYGLKFKFVVNSKSLINISISRYVDNMELADGYLKEEYTNFNQRTTTTYVGLNYQLSF